MTVVLETESSQMKGYKTATYVEFLEALGWISVFFFQGSEMEERELKWKIEYILSEMFQEVLHTLLYRNY